MLKCFPCALDFGTKEVTTRFMESLNFLNIIFAELPGGKSGSSGEFSFFYIFALKSLNLVLIHGAKCMATGALGQGEKKEYLGRI